METITITRIGPEKTIDYTNKKTGKPDSFKKVGVLTNEHGEKWFDVTFRGECPVQVGKSYEVTITEREYQTKAGETRTAYSAELPRTNTHQKFGVDHETKNKVTTLELRFNKLMSVLVSKGILEMPEPAKPTIPGTTVEYPDGHEGSVPFEHPLESEFKPEDIPFDTK